MTIPPNTITDPEETVSAEHRELHQLTGKTIRKAVLNIFAIKDKSAADLMIACSDGSAIRIEASGSVKIEILP